MANVGSGAPGKTLIGAGNGQGPTYASIGTNSGLTSNGVVISKGNSAFVATAAGSTGTVLTGNTGSAPTFQSPQFVGFIWSEKSGAFTSLINNGYFITTTASTTLPGTPSEGDTIKFIVDTTNLLTVTANTGQKIRIGTTLSAAAGTAVNTQQGDSVTLVYKSTNTTWIADSANGGWNVN